MRGSAQQRIELQLKSGINLVADFYGIGAPDGVENVQKRVINGPMIAASDIRKRL